MQKYRSITLLKDEVRISRMEPGFISNRYPYTQLTASSKDRIEDLLIAHRRDTMTLFDLTDPEVFTVLNLNR